MKKGLIAIVVAAVVAVVGVGGYMMYQKKAEEKAYNEEVKKAINSLPSIVVYEKEDLPTVESEFANAGSCIDINSVEPDISNVYTTEPGEYEVKYATHIMSLANPLTCVRGFSSEGKSSTLVQMIFATDNVGFTVSDIDYTKIDADIEREIQELEATSVTKEAEEAAQEIYDENNEEMKNVFTPEFGFRTDADRRERQVSGVRTSFGNETDKVESRKATKIGSANDARIKGVRETDEDDENIPDNRV